MNAIQLNEQAIAADDQRYGPLLSERDVATICRLSTAAIRRWRLLGKGPRYIKIHSAVRYRLEDVWSWLDARPSGGAPAEVA